MKVVAYARVSTEQQSSDGASLDAQEARLRAYCVAMGLELVAVIRDEGQSAKSLNRPGLQTALGMLESGQAQGLLVTKLDRLTRSVRDLGELLESHFSRFDLLSLGDSVDTRSAAGRLMLNLLTSVAQWEREATGERTRAVLGHMKAEGVKLGRARLGEQHSDARDEDGRRLIEAVADEAAAVARIIDLRRRGASLREIAETLSAEGLRTKQGLSTWSPKVVRSACLREGLS